MKATVSKEIAVTFEESDIEDLYELIAGEGKWWFFGGYFHTWPGRDDNADALQRMAVELERRGKIRRHLEEPGHVCWVKT